MMGDGVNAVLVKDAVFLPAVGALPPYLVAAEQLARLQGMRMTLARGSIVVGAPLGGAVVAASGIAAAFALNALTFAVSVLALATVRLRPGLVVEPAEGSGRARGMGREVRAGLAVAARSPLLRTILLVSAVAELGFTGPFNVGITLLAQERGWGAAGVGMIVGGFGVGAATAAVAVSVLGRLPRAGLLVGPLAVLTGGAIAAVGFAPTRLGGRRVVTARRERRSGRHTRDGPAAGADTAAVPGSGDESEQPGRLRWHSGQLRAHRCGRRAMGTGSGVLGWDGARGRCRACGSVEPGAAPSRALRLGLAQARGLRGVPHEYRRRVH